jgi:hypothetical protein
LLAVCSFHCSIHCLNVLINLGACVCQLNDVGRTCHHFAVAENQLAILMHITDILDDDKLLLKPDRQRKTILQFAVEPDNLDVFIDCL